MTDDEERLEYHNENLRLEAEIERLREKVRHLTKLLDDQLGTPCEQIRHQQEIELGKRDPSALPAGASAGTAVPAKQSLSDQMASGMVGN